MTNRKCLWALPDGLGVGGRIVLDKSPKPTETLFCEMGWLQCPSVEDSYGSLAGYGVSWKMPMSQGWREEGGQDN